MHLTDTHHQPLSFYMNRIMFLWQINAGIWWNNWACNRCVCGGMYKLTPDQITSELRAAQAEGLTNESGLYIAIVLNADPDWEKIGTLQIK